MVVSRVMLVHCYPNGHTLMEGKGEGRGHPSKTMETVCLSCLLTNWWIPLNCTPFKWILEHSFGINGILGVFLTNFERSLFSFLDLWVENVKRKIHIWYIAFFQL